MIYYFGTFEPHCLSYLQRCVDKGGTIVDVGANIGVYTLESSLIVGQTGRVIAIEAAVASSSWKESAEMFEKALKKACRRSARGEIAGRGAG